MVVEKLPHFECQKPKTILFGTKRKLAISNDESLKVYIKVDPIGNLNSFKYLGISLDPSLTWITNIDKLVSKTELFCLGVFEMSSPNIPLTYFLVRPLSLTLTIVMSYGECMQD